MEKEEIVEAVESILGALSVLSEKVSSVLDDYRATGKASVLGDELENLEIFELEKLSSSMGDLVFQIENSEFVYKDNP